MSLSEKIILVVVLVVFFQSLFLFFGAVIFYFSKKDIRQNPVWRVLLILLAMGVAIFIERFRDCFSGTVADYEQLFTYGFVVIQSVLLLNVIVMILGVGKNFYSFLQNNLFPVFTVSFLFLILIGTAGLVYVNEKSEILACIMG